MADENEINVKVKGDASGLEAPMESAKSQVAEATTYMRERFDGLATVVERVKLPFLAIAAILGGGELFKDAIEHTGELAERMEVLTQQTNMPVEALSRLSYAATLSEVSTDTLDKGLTRLAYNMGLSLQTASSTAARAFETLGIKVADAQGHLRPTADVLGDLADKFSKMQDGSTKTAMAMQIFGRSGAEMIPLLNQGRAGIQSLGEEADRLGVTMTSSMQATAIAYEDSMKRLKAAGEGLMQHLATALMPSLTQLAAVFTNVAARASSSGGLAAALEVLADAFKAVITVGEALYVGFVALWNVLTAINDTIAVFVDNTVSALGHIGRMIVDAVTHNWIDMSRQASATGALMRSAASDSADRWKQAMANIDAASTNAWTDIKTLWSDNPAASEKKGGGTETPPPIQAMTKPKSMLPEFREEWNQIRDGEGEFVADLTQQEIAFWRQKLELVKAGSKDYLAIRHELATLERNDAKAGYELELADIKTQQDAIVGTDNVAAARRHELALEEFDYITSFYHQGTREYESALQAREKADEQFNKQIEANAKKAADDQKKELEKLTKVWDSALQPISHAFDQAMNGVMQGTQRFQDAFRKMISNIEAAFISATVRMLTKWVATELAKSTATAVGTTGRTAMEQTSAEETVLAWVAAGLKTVAVDAYRAAAAAYASIAAIPVIGPILAPISAAAALAAVFEIGSSIASAAGGYDIPAGVNPITQLHEREMVLPAALADQVRNSASGGGGLGGDHFHIHVVDKTGMEQLLQRHGATIGSIVRQQIRGGGLNLNNLGFQT